MIHLRFHFGEQRHFARKAHFARWVGAVWFSAVLAAAPAPAWTQSQTGTAAPAAATSQASESDAAHPRPDKNRARNAFQAGRRAEQSGDWNAAFAAYSEAATYDPSNRQYPILKEHARFQVVQGFVNAAERQGINGKMDNARALLSQALKIDPNYAVARERLAELSTGPPASEPEKGPRLAGLPRLSLKPGNHDFDYSGTTRGAYQEVGRQFGVTLAFDGELQDRQVHFQVPQVDFDTAVMVLARQTKTFTRVVDAHTLFVAEDSPQKQKEYALEVEKALVLPASVTADEMNETVRTIREMTGITRTQLDTTARTLTVRSTEQNVALAETILEQLEQPRGELMLEIEILEVNRDAAHELGIIPPSSSKVFMLSQAEVRQLQAAPNTGTLIQILESIFGSSAGSSSSAVLPLIPFGGGKTIFIATLPSASANFSQAISAVRSAQRILLRAQDGKPATFFVGDRYPVTLSLLSSNLNPASSTLEQALLTGSLPRTDYTTGANPVAVAVAQFNNSGHLDLAVANQKDGTISILPGNGDGTFGTRTTISLPSVTSGTSTIAASPSAIVVGDFNNDGNQDIAVVDAANNRVLILLGNGDGTFKNAVAYSTISSTALASSGHPVALLAADFDGDGEPDLAVVNQADGTTPGSVAILLGNKTGNVQDGTFTLNATYAVGTLPTAITTADFNADTAVDLAVTNQKDNTVSVLLGKLTGGTQNGTFGTQTTFGTGAGPAGAATGDFNSDGHEDLAVTNQTDSTVSILLGKGDGTFSTATDFTAGSGPVGIATATFVGSTTDLAVADESGNNVDVLIGNGDGTFSTPLSLPTGNSPVALAVADLGGSGAEDLVSVNNASNSVTVYLNTVSSSPSTPSSQTPYPGSEYVDLGLKVKATPRLHDDGEVTLQLQFDIKSLSGSNVNGIPILGNRNIEQTIRLREGETSVLSGLIEQNETRSVTGFPYTSTAPGIGLLTGEQSTDNTQTETLIILTPHVLRLPPHDVPAVYAGRGEPATPPSPPPTLPPPAGQPGVAPPPPPGQPGQPGQTTPQPGQPFPPQTGQPTFGPGAQPRQFPGGQGPQGLPQQQ